MLCCHLLDLTDGFDWEPSVGSFLEFVASYTHTEFITHLWLDSRIAE